MRSAKQFNADVGAALLGFNEEAVPYCQGISDADEHEYAMDYARMLRSRAKGLEFERANFSVHLFEPNRNLIKAKLDRMYGKYFATEQIEMETGRARTENGKRNSTKGLVSANFER